MIVVDDHHLFALLAGQAGPQLQAELEAARVLTTSGWYYRLARAAHDSRLIGVTQAPYPKAQANRST